MTDSLDTIVLGVGSLGSAALMHLARRGQRVLGIEQFEIPHVRGSHHGQSRMLRAAYFEHAGYVPLVQRAVELWRELNASPHGQIFYETGGIFLGMLEGELIAGSITAATQHDLPHTLLTAAAVRQRYPALRPTDELVGFFDDGAGYILPERAVQVMTDAAVEAGAQVRMNTRVHAWRADGRGVEVETSAGVFRAGTLVLTAGAWTAGLMADLAADLAGDLAGGPAGRAKLPLRVSRQVLAWTRPKSKEAAGALATLPVWGIEAEDGVFSYGFPMFDAAAGFKSAIHRPGETTDPELASRGPDAADEAEIRAQLARFIPGADGPLVSMATCLYTNTPDGHFIIDRHPDYEQVVMACGTSGHGFKFAPAIGEVLADLAQGATPRVAIEFLRRGRFG